MTPNHRIALIAVDLDGTLLNSRHQLTPRTVEALRRAIAQGVQVVLATGKTRHSALEAIRRLDLQTPGVFLQGLIIANPDGSIRRRHTLDESTVLSIADFARQRRVSMVAYSGDRILTERRTEYTDKLIAFHEPTPEEVTSLTDILDDHPVSKILLIDETSRIARHREVLTAQFEGRVTLVQALADMLEVLPPGASKGEGLRSVLDDLGIAPEHVMAIGDAENDVEMLRLAGLGVAVGNAMPPAKAAADVVVASNDADGVAEAVERFVLHNTGDAEK